MRALFSLWDCAPVARLYHSVSGARLETVDCTTRLPQTNGAYKQVLKWSRQRSLMNDRRTEMSNWSKSAIVAAVIAATGLAGVGVAMARGGDCEYAGRKGEYQSARMGNPEHMRERVEERLAGLKSSLALREDQRDAWNTLEQTVQGQLDAAGKRMMEMREAKKPTTAIERMQRMEEMTNARSESMGEVRKAVEALYSRLDASQQKTFDEQFRMTSPGREGHRRGGMMGPGGMG